MSKTTHDDNCATNQIIRGTMATVATPIQRDSRHSSDTNSNSNKHGDKERKIQRTARRYAEKSTDAMRVKFQLWGVAEDRLDSFMAAWTSMTYTERYYQVLTYLSSMDARKRGHLAGMEAAEMAASNVIVSNTVEENVGVSRVTYGAPTPTSLGAVDVLRNTVGGDVVTVTDYQRINNYYLGLFQRFRVASHDVFAPTPVNEVGPGLLRRLGSYTLHLITVRQWRWCLGIVLAVYLCWDTLPVWLLRRFVTSPLITAVTTFFSAQTRAFRLERMSATPRPPYRTGRRVFLSTGSSSTDLQGIKPNADFATANAMALALHYVTDELGTDDGDRDLTAKYLPSSDNAKSPFPRLSSLLSEIETSLQALQAASREATLAQENEVAGRQRLAASIHAILSDMLEQQELKTRCLSLVYPAEVSIVATLFAANSTNNERQWALRALLQSKTRISWSGSLAAFLFAAVPPWSSPGVTCYLRTGIWALPIAARPTPQAVTGMGGKGKLGLPLPARMQQRQVALQERLRMALGQYRHCKASSTGALDALRKAAQKVVQPARKAASAVEMATRRAEEAKKNSRRDKGLGRGVGHGGEERAMVLDDDVRALATGHGVLMLCAGVMRDYMAWLSYSEEAVISDDDLDVVDSLNEAAKRSSPTDDILWDALVDLLPELAGLWRRAAQGPVREMAYH